MLYRELFVRCQEFHWVCILEKARELPADLIAQFYHLYGVQIFTDERSALTSFTGIDAVITTFAVAHAAHSRFIRFIALAYELGLPVFELQHGLYQLGINYSERSALVGSGLPGALTALDAPNLTQRKLVWGEAHNPEDVSVGYPPYVRDIFDSPAWHRPNQDNVLIASNMHWNILSEEDVSQIWDYMVHLFKHLPDINFVLMPHPGEMKSAALRRGLERCRVNGIRNVEVKRPKDRDAFIEMISQARMALSMVSTVLLDFEMYELPCILLPSAPQAPLVAGLQHARCPENKADLVDLVKETFYGDSEAVLRTGILQEFRPDRLVAALREALRPTRPPLQDAVPLIAKYLQGVK